MLGGLDSLFNFSLFLMPILAMNDDLVCRTEARKKSFLSILLQGSEAHAMHPTHVGRVQCDQIKIAKCL